MATATLIPLDQYLSTSYRPDREYQHMGVETIWIIDPATRTARACSGPNWVEATRLEVAGTPIYVELASLFRQLDGETA